MLAKARAFFASREILEVDVPVLSQQASVDAHIDLIQATCCGKRCFLHSSPEYGMKKLLSLNHGELGDIYQLSHVFREEELGEWHHPEFMMAEWYRIGITFEEMIEETLAFVSLFLDVDSGFDLFSYKSLFKADFPDSLEERDRIFAFDIEPQLGEHRLAVVKDFPPEQAALSQISGGVAERFEVFYRGVELANGYHELLNAHEQKKRLDSANQMRVELGKESYPVDRSFIEALENGIPDCCGVAVGFDRLMMLRHNVEKIDDILPLSILI